MKAFKAALFALALLVSGVALARTPVPVVNYLDQPVVTASGKTLTVEQLQDVIRKIASEKKWVVMSNPNGVMVASLTWNANKHTIMVEIVVAPDRYSLKYNNSINMKYAISKGEYGIADGLPIIHPYYNRFVNDLHEGIRLELMKY